MIVKKYDSDLIGSRLNPYSLPKELFVVYEYKFTEWFKENTSDDLMIDFITLPETSFSPLIGELLESQGYESQRNWEDYQWDEVDPVRATKYLINQLRFSQAYKSEIRTKEVAKRLAEELLDNFRKHSRFFCSSEAYKYLDDEGNDTRSGSKCTSEGAWISGYTFDKGVIVLDDNKIGMIWSFDED